MTTLFDYTSEEINIFVSEIRNYKLPTITRFWKKIGLVFLKYSFLPAFIIMAVFGVLYNDTHIQWMWVIIESIGLFYIFGMGGIILISHLIGINSTNKLRKKLGLSTNDFNSLVIMCNKLN